MNTTRLFALLCGLIALLGQAPVGAFHVPLSRADMERALALARVTIDFAKLD